MLGNLGTVQEIPAKTPECPVYSPWLVVEDYLAAKTCYSDPSAEGEESANVQRTTPDSSSLRSSE